MNSLEIDMNIPLSHPWVREIRNRHQMQWPLALMSFAGIECAVRLTGIGEIVYQQEEEDEPDYMKTTWKSIWTHHA
jgi:hypothetical protein